MVNLVATTVRGNEVVHKLLHRVRIIHHMPVPVASGVDLSTRALLPEDPPEAS